MEILNKENSINNGALYENVVAQELYAKGLNVYYYNSKKQGELDFVLETDGKVLALEIKSGKNYVEVNQKRVYLPIYMIMFLENKKMKNNIYIRWI